MEMETEDRDQASTALPTYLTYLIRTTAYYGVHASADLL